jgi:kinesin family member C2/C3
VFTPESTQEEVYEETRPLVSSALDGYNVSVFAYGQTGSGKTHTMGMMNSRALEDLFKIADEKRMIARYDFKLSAIEIYNEQVRDLLEPNDASGKQKKLDVKTDAATGASTVPDMLHSPCTSINDVDRLMDLATKNRTSASTSMNQHSSRSHLILTVHITRIDLVNGGTLFGKLHLIDLAGSERLSRTGAEGDRLTEAKNINKSLSALGNCISALVTKSKHVPYRDSKLTFLLQDSLGMDSKTLMFVCASPAEADVTGDEHPIFSVPCIVTRPRISSSLSVPSGSHTAADTDV